MKICANGCEGREVKLNEGEVRELLQIDGIGWGFVNSFDSVK